jgi:hypothetical protein
LKKVRSDREFHQNADDKQKLQKQILKQQTFFSLTLKFHRRNLIKQNHSLDIPCFAEEVILHTDADLTGHEEISEGVGLNNIYEVALENEIYLEQGPSITNKYG